MNNPMNPRQPARKRPAAAVIAAAVLALAVAACQGAGTGSSSQDDLGPTGTSPETTIQRAGPGEQTYRARCYVCHGEDLTGTASGPSLAELRDTYGEAGAQSRIQAVIEEGSATNPEYPAMPPIIGLSEEEIGQLAAYILEGSSGGQ